MAEREPKKELNQYDVEFARVVENGKTFRTVAICAVIAIGIICLTAAMYMITKPPWEGFLLALFGPAGLIYTLYKAHLKYVKKTHRRTAFLEKLLDPGRTSSEEASPARHNEVLEGRSDPQLPGGSTPQQQAIKQEQAECQQVFLDSGE